MALTVTVDADSPSTTLNGRGVMQAQLTEVLATVQCDDSYPNTPGYPVDPTDFDANATELVRIEPAWSEDAASVNRLQIDRTTPETPTFRVFVGATNAEVADTTDLSGASGKFLVRAVVKTPNG